MDPLIYLISITGLNKIISAYEAKAGEQFKAEVETHIRDEFSTLSWIMEGMLARAGFEIEKSKTLDGFVMKYFVKRLKK